MAGRIPHARYDQVFLPTTVTVSIEDLFRDDDVVADDGPHMTIRSHFQCMDSVFPTGSHSGQTLLCFEESIVIRIGQDPQATLFFAVTIDVDPQFIADEEQPLGRTDAGTLLDRHGSVCIETQALEGRVLRRDDETVRGFRFETDPRPILGVDFMKNLCGKAYGKAPAAFGGVGEADIAPGEGRVTGRPDDLDGGFMFRIQPGQIP